MKISKYKLAILKIFSPFEPYKNTELKELFVKMLLISLAKQNPAIADIEAQYAVKIFDEVLEEVIKRIE